MFVYTLATSLSANFQYFLYFQPFIGNGPIEDYTIINEKHVVNGWATSFHLTFLIFEQLSASLKSELRPFAQIKYR